MDQEHLDLDREEEEELLLARYDVAEYMTFDQSYILRFYYSDKKLEERDGRKVPVTLNPISITLKKAECAYD